MADLGPIDLTNLAEIWGPGLVGVFLASFCAGILANQVAQYYKRYPQDGRTHKILVALLSANAAISWAGNWVFVWRNVIVAPLEPAIVFTTPGYMLLPVATPIFASCCSEVFFGMRAWKLWGRRLWVAGLLSIMPLAHLAVGLICIIWQIMFPSKKVREGGFIPRSEDKMLATTFCVTAGTDIVITGAIVLGLRRKTRRERGFSRKTDSLVNRLLRLSVSTAAITTTLAIIGAIILETTLDTSRLNAIDALAFSLPHTTALVVVGTLNQRHRSDLSDETTYHPGTPWSGETSTGSITKIGSMHATSTIGAPSHRYAKKIPDQAPPSLYPPTDSFPATDSGHRGSGLQSFTRSGETDLERQASREMELQHQPSYASSWNSPPTDEMGGSQVGLNSTGTNRRWTQEDFEPQRHHEEIMSGLPPTPHTASLPVQPPRASLPTGETVHSSRHYPPMVNRPHVPSIQTEVPGSASARQSIHSAQTSTFPLSQTQRPPSIEPRRAGSLDGGSIRGPRPMPMPPSR